MKKSDLKTGMNVELRDGKKYLVFIGVDHDFDNTKCFLVDKFGDLNWFNLEKNFSDDLKYKGLSSVSHDIMKVYSCKHPFSFTSKEYLGDLLWERDESPIILTLDGVEYSKSTLRSLIKKATNN